MAKVVDLFLPEVAPYGYFKNIYNLLRKQYSPFFTSDYFSSLAEYPFKDTDFVSIDNDVLSDFYIQLDFESKGEHLITIEDILKQIRQEDGEEYFLVLLKILIALFEGYDFMPLKMTCKEDLINFLNIDVNYKPIVMFFPQFRHFLKIQYDNETISVGNSENVELSESSNRHGTQSAWMPF